MIAQNQLFLGSNIRKISSPPNQSFTGDSTMRFLGNRLAKRQFEILLFYKWFEEFASAARSEVETPTVATDGLPYALIQARAFRLCIGITNTHMSSRSLVEGLEKNGSQGPTQNKVLSYRCPVFVRVLCFSVNPTPTTERELREMSERLGFPCFLDTREDDIIDPADLAISFAQPISEDDA